MVAKLESNIPKVFKNSYISKGTLNTKMISENILNFLSEDYVMEKIRFSIKNEHLELFDRTKKLIRLIELTKELNYIDEMIDYKLELRECLNNLIDLMNDIAPKGTVFSSHVGDGSLLGFWTDKYSTNF